MTTFEEHLSHMLHTVADEVAPGATLDDRVWSGLVRPRPASRRPLVVASAAALALVMAAVAVARPWDARSTPVRTLGGGSLAGAGPDTWTGIPKAPVAPRNQFLEAWTGSQMLVWGGDAGTSELADGAAFTPAAGTWDTIPAGPLPATAGPVGAWDGSELLVFAGNPTPATSPGAAYNPATGRWRSLKPFPLGAVGDAGSYAVWTGSRLLVWGFFGNDARNSERGTTDTRAAEFDPSTNTWTETSAAPVAAPIFGDGFWTGAQLLVYGQVGTSGSSAGQPQLVSYTPATDAWQVLPAPPSPVTGGGAAAWTGTELVVGGGSEGGPGLLPNAAAFNPATGTWRTLPDAPEGFTGNWRYRDLWTGTDVLILDDGDAQGRPLLFNPATDTWRFGAASPVPGRTDGPAVWDGTAALVWGGGRSQAEGSTTPATVDVAPTPGASPAPATFPAGTPEGTSCCTSVEQGYSYTPPS
ncbi:MAG TPA: hypothetical protein VFW71_09905 [Actinomycetota bacterium]|nr:hypothetical protein [Actinomycetota bacterium]